MLLRAKNASLAAMAAMGTLALAERSEVLRDVLPPPAIDWLDRLAETVAPVVAAGLRPASYDAGTVAQAAKRLPREFAGEARPQAAVFTPSTRHGAVVQIGLRRAGKERTVGVLGRAAEAVVGLENGGRTTGDFLIPGTPSESSSSPIATPRFPGDVYAALGLSQRAWNLVKDRCPDGVAVDNVTKKRSFDHDGRAYASFPAASEGAPDLVIHLRSDDLLSCIMATERVVNSIPQDAIAFVKRDFGFKPAPPTSLANVAPVVSPTTMPSCTGHQTREEERVNGAIPNVGGAFMMYQKYETKAPASFPKLGPPLATEDHAAATSNPASSSSLPTTTLRDLSWEARVIGKTSEGEYACARAGFDLIKNPGSLGEAVKAHAISPSSHVARVLGLDPEGKRLAMRRESLSWLREDGSGGGALFVGYSPDPEIFRYFLRRTDGKADALLSHFSCRRTALVYVPSRKQLEEISKLKGA